jgi:hypothetical protein
MKSRISLVTALAVGATVVAGSAAIAANIGVLTSAEDNSIGNLSAETPVETPPTTENVQIVDVYVEDPSVATTEAPDDTTAPTTSAPESDVREFAVEAAGTVSVEQTETGLFVAEVAASEGWLWKTEQTSAGEVRVTFASVDTIYEFVASLDDDGEVIARVDQPIVNVVQIPGQAPAPGGGANTAPAASSGGGAPATMPSSGYDDDDDHEDDHEDDHDDGHEEDDQEYRGGEDDD